MSYWSDSLYELIRRTSTDLPTDVEDALKAAAGREEPDSNAARTLATILENARLARDKQQPLCQDTGSLLLWVDAPAGLAHAVFERELGAAVERATQDGILRQNCVDPLTGCNTGNNLGPGSPCIHWHEQPGDTVDVALILKGGGCENVGIQYALPDTSLGAGRDLAGVRTCLLDAVWRAQGRGCAPGVLGVCIGGDRATGYAESKRQLLRTLGERSETPALADLENDLLEAANSLGIGPMGLGGETTILDLFVGALGRVPASYFVSVSYMCWAFRRRRVSMSLDGKITGATVPVRSRRSAFTIR